MDDTLARKLLAAIEQDRLAILCGAGLSMARPSSVPSASVLALNCAAKYHSITGGNVPHEANQNLEALARYFIENNQFRLFIEKLVDWGPFRTMPNPGHLAIADFLACGGVGLVVTTNVDELVELAARRLGERDFLPALDGTEAATPRPHRPFLKLHGCIVRDRLSTLWSPLQLAGGRSLLLDRLASSKVWLPANLMGRHLIFLGFWTDWDYLNDILLGLVQEIEPPLLVLVNPDTEEILQAKAPRLWEWAQTHSVEFHPVQQSGADFLDELRRRFSRQFIERLWESSIPDYKLACCTETDPSTTIPEDVSTEEWYALRRDSCGIPPGNVVRDKQLTPDMLPVGTAHLMLRERGAALEGPRFRLPNGQKIRVVKGSGRPLSAIKATFVSEGSNPPDDITICAGSEPDGDVLWDIVRGNTEASVVRAGLSGNWLTLAQARAQDIC